MVDASLQEASSKTTSNNKTPAIEFLNLKKSKYQQSLNVQLMSHWHHQSI